MTSARQIRNWFRCISPRATTAALAVAVVLTIVAIQTVQAQTFQVLHTFTGGADGYGPSAGLTMDEGGNLYGTTYQGGTQGLGTVFKLMRKNSQWVFVPLYGFAGGNDGAHPYARVIFGPDGTLYGTTNEQGGGYCGGYGCGTVFNLRPPPTACKTALCPWTERVIYHFSGGSGDGGNPLAEVTFDQAGNLYGTTAYGGPAGNGTLYELMPANGGWTESVLYAFSFSPDGAEPVANVMFDKAGNLFGTTEQGGAYEFGTVFQLTQSGSGWTEKTLYSFSDGSDGAFPSLGLIFDASGNLYGATGYGGSSRTGTAFELTPSNDSWNFNLIYTFTGVSYEDGPMYGNLAMDGAGNVYGVTYGNGLYDCGTVFKLTPSNGTWTETVLHDFTCGNDSGFPVGGVVLDKMGNIYGTASGGPFEAGVVWEITP